MDWATNRLCQKKLFTVIQTINWAPPQLPAQWGSTVKPRGTWHSFCPVSLSNSWAEAQHRHRAVPPQALCFYTVLGVHITVFPPNPSLYCQVSLQPDVDTSCQCDLSAPFQQFQVPFSCQLLIHGPCQGSLHSDPLCMSAKAHYAQALFAVSSWPWLITLSHSVLGQGKAMMLPCQMMLPCKMKDIFSIPPLKVSIYSCQMIIYETLGWFSISCFCIPNTRAACGLSSPWCKLQELFGFLQFTAENYSSTGNRNNV